MRENDFTFFSIAAEEIPKKFVEVNAISEPSQLILIDDLINKKSVGIQFLNTVLISEKDEKI